MGFFRKKGGNPLVWGELAQGSNLWPTRKENYWVANWRNENENCGMSGNYRVALTSSPLLPSLFFFSNFSFNKNQILYRKIEKMNKIVANSSLFLQTPLLPNFNNWKRNSFRFFKLGKNSFKRWRKGEGRGPPRDWIFISNYARWEKRFLLLFVRIKTAPSVDWLNFYTISSPLKIHHPANIPPPLPFLQTSTLKIHPAALEALLQLAIFPETPVYGEVEVRLIISRRPTSPIRVKSILGAKVKTFVGGQCEIII